MQEPQSDGQARQPTVSPVLIRQMPIAVLATVLATAGIAAIGIGLTHRADWWPAYVASLVVAMIGALASVVIILRSAGKPADFVVTMVMLLSLVRIGVSLIGLIVCVKVLQTPPDPTAAMIGGYYVATLLVESLLVRRALQPARAGNG
jgi:ABC-type transport system involved in multi-copper enzyme maturation permease subunit